MGDCILRAVKEARAEYGKLRFEELNYGSYLKIPQLLALQELRSRPQHHDEMFFIVIHQSFELWFKEVLHELDLLGEHLAQDSVSRALKTVKRVNLILDCLGQQIQLLSTLTPVEFAGFRAALGAGSGFQSLQFREIEYACGLRDAFFQDFFSRWPESGARLRARAEAPSVYDHFLRALARPGHVVPPEILQRDVRLTHELHPQLVLLLQRLYQQPKEEYHWVLLAEALLDLDTAWSRWRAVHVLMVSRTIGGQAGTGGSSGAAFLESRLKLRFFPELWEVRNALWGEQA